MHCSKAGTDVVTWLIFVSHRPVQVNTCCSKLILQSFVALLPLLLKLLIRGHLVTRHSLEQTFCQTIVGLLGSIIPCIFDEGAIIPIFRIDGVSTNTNSGRPRGPPT